MWKRLSSAKLRTKIGLAFTVGWLVVMVALTVWKRDKVPAMELNALGDFFAGAFAPLAFLWLVIGYAQQGEELEQNSLALRQQADELAHSVEAQRSMAETANRRLEATLANLAFERERLERERREHVQMNQPVFRFQSQTASFSPTTSRQESLMRNSGKTATNISLIPTQSSLTIEPSSVPILSEDEGTRIVLTFGPTAEDGGLMVRYTDRLGNDSEVQYKTYKDQNGFLQFRPIAPT